MTCHTKLTLKKSRIKGLALELKTGVRAGMGTLNPAPTSAPTNSPTS